MKRRRALRFVDGMRHQGLVKRMGVKGWAVWALKAYSGPRPKVVHHAHISPSPRRAFPSPDAKAKSGNGFYTSWWVDAGPQRADFASAARARAHEQGWDK